MSKGAPYAFEAPSQGPGHSFPDANVQLTGQGWSQQRHASGEHVVAHAALHGSLSRKR